MMLSPRRDAIQKAKEILSQKPVYLDTETTGTGPNDNILEIAIIDHDSLVLLDTLVKPVGSIHPDAQAVHGIEDALLQDAPRWNQIWPEIEDILSNRLVGVYNADFDLRMMQQSHSRNWLSWCPPKGMQLFCIMKLYAQFYGQWDSRRSSYRWHSLESAGRQCGIPLPNSHRAKEDAKLTGAVLEYIADQQG